MLITLGHLRRMPFERPDIAIFLLLTVEKQEEEIVALTDSSVGFYDLATDIGEDK
jgi:hypothetical protein